MRSLITSFTGRAGQKCQVLRKFQVPNRCAEVLREEKVPSAKGRQRGRADSTGRGFRRENFQHVSHSPSGPRIRVPLLELGTFSSLGTLGHEQPQALYLPEPVLLELGEGGGGGAGARDGDEET